MSSQNYKLDWKADELYNGCILASIAHAIMVAHYPELSNEQSWDGENYSVQDNSGMRGTVTFHDGFCTAAFRNDNSDRISTVLPMNAIDYFRNASKEIIKLAETETLQYLLEKVGGKTIPVITTAFWGDKNGLFTVDSLDEMLKNGGELLKRQVLGHDLSVQAWQEYYDMSEPQVNLLKSIYLHKITNPKGILTISKKEIDLIGIDDEDGLDESRESFSEMGIEWEEI